MTPLTTMLAARRLTNQIDHVVLSMDIPFKTVLGTNANSTTSALFYGLKTDNGTDAGVTNSFARSESSFHQAKPASAPNISFLTTMLTANTLSTALQVVNRGVTSDGTFPTQPVILAKTSDPARNTRYYFFDNAIFNAQVFGGTTLIRTNSDNPSGQTGLLGYETGLMRYQTSPGTFIPGAIADNMTSYGGLIFGGNDQTNLLSFIEAGATGSYGTVAEPLSDTDKFPNPQIYFYQSRGFSIVESYYMSIASPYLGLIVAEPLASPFALRGSGSWSMGISNSILSSNISLTVNFTANDLTRPLSQVDLFVDGKYQKTLTNISPRASNILALKLNGYPYNYIVPTNATITSIASDITELINNTTATTATKIKALSWGDRIELQSTSTNHSSFPFYTSDTASSTQIGAVYRAKYLPESFPPRMMQAGWNNSSGYQMQVEIPTALKYVVQASTNLVEWFPIWTNTASGVLNFHDDQSTTFASRYYRIAGPVPDQPPKISAPTKTNGGPFRLRMESQIGQSVAILVSSNQIDWVAAETNQAGGVIDWTDNNSTSISKRYYRAMLIPIPQPTLSTITNSTQPSLVRIDNPVQPYVVEVSTNGTAWAGVTTNFSYGDIQTDATSAAGNADIHSTFIKVSRPTFISSSARGVMECKINKLSPLAVGDYLRFAILKTNGQIVVVSATNQIAGSNYTNLIAQIVNQINSHPLLQSSDGIVAEDFSISLSFSTVFLRARSPGYVAAGVFITPTKKGSSWILIPGAGYLRANVSDLQPRNHLYVSSGALSINTTFPLDTTALPDGYHELTAVAYEGTSVRTQTRTTIPVRIQNTSLSATMTLLDLTNNATAQGSYQIQVTANTNNVSSITLFTTGGAMATATNISDAIFPVHGTNLWDGLHPFYALVETTTGEKYRTRTEWIRLSP